MWWTTICGVVCPKVSSHVYVPRKVMLFMQTRLFFGWCHLSYITYSYVNVIFYKKKKNMRWKCAAFRLRGHFVWLRSRVHHHHHHHHHRPNRKKEKEKGRSHVTGQLNATVHMTGHGLFSYCGIDRRLNVFTERFLLSDVPYEQWIHRLSKSRQRRNVNKNNYRLVNCTLFCSVLSTHLRLQRRHSTPSLWA